MSNVLKSIIERIQVDSRLNLDENEARIIAILNDDYIMCSKIIESKSKQTITKDDVHAAAICAKVNFGANNIYVVFKQEEELIIISD